MHALPLLLGLLVSLPAAAYETDQVTGRQKPLRPADEVANARVNEMLLTAAERTNQKTGCGGSDERTRRVLATEIDKLFSHSKYVANRGELVSGMGFGAYTAWLEESGVDRRAFLDRSDIFGTLTATESLVMSTFGVCSTIELAGVPMGTDKVDHFWAQGYEYQRQSGWGKDPEKAVEWGTQSELGKYGLLTSNVFSFADLHANWRGFQFYQGLLGRQSVLQRDEDGCVALTQPFDWTHWMDDGMDEVLNPSVFTRPVAAGVQERLDEGRAEICSGYESWGQDYVARRDRVLHEVVNEYSAAAPKRESVLDLEALCGDREPKVSRAP